MNTFDPSEMLLGVSYYPDYVSDFLASESPVFSPRAWSGSEPSAEMLPSSPAGTAPSFLQPSIPVAPIQAPAVSAKDIQDRIIQDLDAMKDLELGLIRMGEFSWHHVEPEPGRYNPELFLFALDEAQKRNLKVIFCTPTATPPVWLTRQHPEILPIDRDGRTLAATSRRHYNLANAAYREHCRRIARYYGETFGIHPAVIGFQIDNEFGCHGSAFQFNPEIRTAFQHWLKKRYRSVEDLNRLWFHSFWSRNVNSFEEIELPSHTYTDNNPHLELEFRRFSTWLTADFQQLQIREIKESCGKWVTHNFMSLFSDLDHWKLARDLDFAGFDHYQMKPFPDASDSAFQFNLLRSLRPDRPFLLLEQQPLQVNWQPVNRRLPYHHLFLWTMQAFLQGAGAVLYFSWQRFRGGAERMHDGILSHDGLQEDSWQRKLIRAMIPIRADIQHTFALAPEPSRSETGNADQPEALSPGGPVEGQSTSQPGFDFAPDAPAGSFRPRALIFLDYEALWAHEICAQSVEYRPLEIIRRLGLLLQSLGYSYGFWPGPEELPEQFKESSLWIFPGANFTLSEQGRQTCQTHLEKGGRILSLPITGQMDYLGRMIPDLQGMGIPGIRRVDFGALGPEENESIQCDSGLLAGDLWSESVEIRTYANDDNECRELATFLDGPYAHKPAAISGERGRGKWLHLCTVPITSGGHCSRWADHIGRWLDLSSRSESPSADHPLRNPPGLAAATADIPGLIYLPCTALGSASRAILNFGTESACLSAELIGSAEVRKYSVAGLKAAREIIVSSRRGADAGGFVSNPLKKPAGELYETSGTVILEPGELILFKASV
ncbi:MAG: hypothetical protein CMN76_14800 [Spirochaetaceae bacterium]|nr:hypothetical protein [Spirochaetaceae bacterium]|tara:strand:+ start:36246 stop:38744 length:2499 start_codon:yes stop_codon:yes gene_type:complete